MIKYGELPVSPGRGVALFCHEGCTEGYAASRGDYFLHDPEAVILCVECGDTMYLGRRVTVIEEIEPEDAA